MKIRFEVAIGGTHGAAAEVKQAIALLQVLEQYLELKKIDEGPFRVVGDRIVRRVVKK